MSSRAVLRVSVVALLAAALAGAAWVGWQMWQVNRDLRAAIDQAAALQSALETGDQAAADAALGRLEGNTAGAADRTSGFTWAVLAHAPWFGDDARGVRLVADVTGELTTEGLAPLVDDAPDLDAMLPRNGRVPLDQLVALQAPVGRASDAFAKADQRLRAEDSSGYVGAFRSEYRELARRVTDAAGALSSADVALRLMPAMLGQDGPRDYLLVFQNNAEVRSTGGLPGLVSILHAEDGRLTLTRQVTAASMGVVDEPVLPLTDAEQQIYGEQLGVFFQDANFTPDFPRTAELMRARWEQMFPEELDGILAVDPVALSYILGATGPVEVDDVDITGANAVDQLLHQTYVRSDDPVAQDAFYQQAAVTIFGHVMSGAGDPRALLRALARGGGEHRIYLASFDEAEQEAIADRPITGDLETAASDNPQVGVYLNDTTGSKMSYFLRTAVRVDSTSCSAGAQLLAGTARLTSKAPLDAAETLPNSVTGGGKYGTQPGTQLVAVRIYGPVDGTVEDVALNGRQFDNVEIVMHETRPVVTAFVSLKAQQTLDLTWRMKTGEDQPGDVQVRVTPGIEPRDSSSVTASSC